MTDRAKPGEPDLAYWPALGEEGWKHRAWLRDGDQTLVLDERRQRTWTLRGDEAAAFDLIASGYSRDRLVDLLCLLKPLPQAEAEIYWGQVIAKMEQEGILPSHAGRAGSEGAGRG
jgi:hypothetical protein